MKTKVGRSIFTSHHHHHHHRTPSASSVAPAEGGDVDTSYSAQPLLGFHARRHDDNTSPAHDHKSKDGEVGGLVALFDRQATLRTAAAVAEATAPSSVLFGTGTDEGPLLMVEPRPADAAPASLPLRSRSFKNTGASQNQSNTSNLIHPDSGVSGDTPKQPPPPHRRSKSVGTEIVLGNSTSKENHNTTKFSSSFQRRLSSFKQKRKQQNNTLLLQRNTKDTPTIGSRKSIPSFNTKNVQAFVTARDNTWAVAAVAAQQQALQPPQEESPPPQSHPRQFAESLVPGVRPSPTTSASNKVGATSASTSTTTATAAATSAAAAAPAQPSPSSAAVAASNTATLEAVAALADITMVTTTENDDEEPQQTMKKKEEEEQEAAAVSFERRIAAATQKFLYDIGRVLQESHDTTMGVVDYVLDTATGSTNSSTSTSTTAAASNTSTFMPTSLNDLLQAQAEEEEIRNHNDNQEEGIEPPPPASRTAATASSSSCQAAAPLFHPMLNEATEEIEEFVREHSQKFSDLLCSSKSNSKNPGSRSVWTTALQQKWEFFVVLQRHHKLWKHQLLHHKMVQQTQAEIALFFKEHHALVLSFIYDDETVAAADTATTNNENAKGKSEGEAAFQQQHTKKKKKKRGRSRPGRIASTGSNSTTRTNNSRRSGNAYTLESIL